MTRSIVYSSALVAVLAATGMTVASIAMPDWVSYSVTAATGHTVSRSIGLHKSCSSVADPACRPYPTNSECQGDERYFCSMWRTTGFLMSLSTVAELATIVGFLVIMGGGKLKREKGWRILSVLLGIVAAIQFCAMALVAYLFDHDKQFIVPGWRLDTSWILCLVSGSLAVLCGLGLVTSAFVLPPENGYEFLDDPDNA